MVSIKKLLAGVAVTAVAGGGILLGATSAFAAAPAWEPDPNALGTISFYDANGNVITNGTDWTNAWSFAAASNAGGTDQSGATKASIGFAFPNHASTTANYFVQSAGGSTAFPVAAPPSVHSIAFPVNTATTVNGGSNIAVASGGGTNDTTAGYSHILEVRLYASGGTAVSNPLEYWATDIQYNSATGAWWEVYPTAVNPTNTSLVASPTSGPAGTNVTLTATESPAVAGSVQFYDGTTALGTPVAVNGSGVATTSTSTLSVATHNLKAVFTPTDSTNNSLSQGTATETVTGPATSTALTVTPTGAGAAGVDTHFTATVTAVIGGAGETAGAVAFYDGATTGTPLGTVTGGATGGVYTLDLPAGLAAGGHAITAVYTPTDPTQSAASQSAVQSFSDTAPASGACAQTGSSCTDTQQIEGAIPVGTLTITTPYNGTACAAPTGTSATAPTLAGGTTPNVNSATSTPGCVGGVLNIGTLALTPTDTMFTASALFQDIVITDNRSGGPGWTVQASSSDLTDGTGHTAGTIDSQNVGLVIPATNANAALGGIYPGVGFAGSVTPVAVNAASPAVAPGATGQLGLGGPTAGVGGVAHTIATATSTLGSVTLNGTITLNAPTSTEAGVFTGTITFTVS